MKCPYNLFFAFFLLSCGGAKTAKQPVDINPVTVIEIDNSVFEYGQQFPAAVDSLLTDLEFIPLETRPESLIGMVTKLFIRGNRIVVFDKFQANGVLIFDRNGKYVNKIRSGKGPGEHTELIDCFVNEKGHIETYEIFTRKIREYTLDGGFLGDKQLPSLYQEGFVSIGDVYFLESPFKRKPNGLYNLFLYNQLTGKITANLFPCNPEDTEKDIFGTSHPMVVYQSRVNYSMPYNDTVFSVDTSGNVQARYVIKYAENALPTGFLSKYKGINPFEAIVENNYVITAQVQESENHLVIDYIFNQNTPYTAIYDKRTKEVVFNSGANDGRLFGDFHFLMGLHKVSSNVFATVYPHIDYPMLYFNNNARMMKQLERFPVEDKSMSNPVLALFRLE